VGVFLGKASGEVIGGKLGYGSGKMSSEGDREVEA